MREVYNFSAGPAVLNKSVLQQVAQAATDYNGSGMSLMEMSHRSQPVVAMVEETTELTRTLLKVPGDYHILWLQGGASTQFSMIPMNLLNENDTADYADTGAWSAKALKEAGLFGKVNVICSSKETVYNHIPKKLNQNKKAVYLHLTSNNTIYGTQWKIFPLPLNPDGLLIADMSSDILSRQIDVSRFGLIYAGAQKNMGPAGVTMVIIRDDILGRVKRSIPTMLNYRTHIEKQSMFNTPPVFSIYVVNRTLKWLNEQGGIAVMESKNEHKAGKLYAEIERNSLFQSPVAVEDHSMMNIPFTITRTELEAEFLSFAAARNLVTLKGHRSIGGFRASIYNAMPEEGINNLIAAMQEFERIHG